MKKIVQNLNCIDIYASTMHVKTKRILIKWLYISWRKGHGLQENWFETACHTQTAEHVSAGFSI